MTDSLRSFDGLDIRERPSRAARANAEIRDRRERLVPTTPLDPMTPVDPMTLVDPMTPVGSVTPLDPSEGRDPLDALVARRNLSRRWTPGAETSGIERFEAGPAERAVADPVFDKKAVFDNPVRDKKAAENPAVDLRAIVEKEVVPRLHRAHRNDLREPRTASIFRQSGALREEVTALGAMLLANDHARACARVDALGIEGRSLAWLIVELLTPIADHLRDVSIDDRHDPAGVTLALFGLQAVARHVALVFRTEDPVPDTGHQVVLIAAAWQGVESVHAVTILSLTAALFRHAGWTAWIARAPDDLARDDTAGFDAAKPDAAKPDAAKPDARSGFPEAFCDVAVIHAPRRPSRDALASQIRALRRRSWKQAIGVIVSGEMFTRDPALSRFVGADMVSSGVGTSLVQANQFMVSPTPRESRR